MPCAQSQSIDSDEKNLLSSIIETAPDAIITIDASGVILSFSPAAEKMFGYAQNEIIGRNVKALMPDPYHSEHDGYISHYLTTGEKRIIGIGREVRASRKNGETFVAELAVGEVSAGDQVIFTGFLRDVTDRVDAQRRAGRLQRHIDQMSRTQALGEMSSALAHEINQPLTAISNFARAAERALDKPEIDREKLARYLSRVAEQSQRAGQIIRRMRSMVEHGQADLAPGDINEIVREAVRSQKVTGASPIDVDLDLEDGLPMVMTDKIQIQQVIINLVRNAQEALAGSQNHNVHIATTTTDASALIRLRAARIEPNQVLVTVSDEGPGIPDDLADQLFEPFVSAKPTGIGVGLSICRSIVQSHGGKIWAENRKDGGADFHFTLPIAESRA